MFLRILLGVSFVSACLFAPNAYAGKTNLSTYYPSPLGEYTGVRASHSLTIPVKTVGNDTTKVTAGEIWFEQT